MQRPAGSIAVPAQSLPPLERVPPQLLELIAGGVAKYLGHPVKVKVKVKDLTCEGCLSDVRAIMCRECNLRTCAFEKGLTYCAQCADFPCQQIIDFNNDGFRHHSEVLDNIRRQQEIGIDAWVKEQEERWCCPNCSCVVDWYAGQCPDCNTTLKGHF